MDKSQLILVPIGVIVGLVYYTGAWEITHSHWVSAVAGILGGIAFYIVLRAFHVFR
jgi:ammonia channel protein AmtB